MPLADHLAARLYRLALRGNVPHEGFLEEVLAAALEHPEVWPRLRARGGKVWEVTPASTPQVQTQVTGDSGRADLLLSWEGGEQLVIELKPWAPPSAEQLDKYLHDLPGAWVTAIAFHTTDYKQPRVLPMLSWRTLRAESWPDEPLIWKQLHCLVDAIGVEMKNLDESTLQGLLPTWDAWEIIESWMRPRIDELQPRLESAGWPCVAKEGKKRQHVEQATRRYGFWLWPAPWKDEEQSGLFFGLYFGNERRPLLQPGMPDLRLMIHLNPDSVLASRLRESEGFSSSVRRWLARSGGAPGDTPSGVRRQHDARWWYLLDARESLTVISRVPNQGDAFRRWVTDRVQEMIDDQVIAQLGKMPR